MKGRFACPQCRDALETHMDVQSVLSLVLGAAITWLFYAASAEWAWCSERAACGNTAFVLAIIFMFLGPLFVWPILAVVMGTKVRRREA